MRASKWKPLFVTVCVMFVLPLLCYLLCLFTVSALENILPQVLYAAILIGCGYGILPLSSGAMGFAQCLEDWFGWKSYDGSLEFAFLLYILCIGAAILGGWILYRKAKTDTASFKQKMQPKTKNRRPPDGTLRFFYHKSNAFA